MMFAISGVKSVSRGMFEAELVGLGNELVAESLRCLLLRRVPDDFQAGILCKGYGFLCLSDDGPFLNDLLQSEVFECHCLQIKFNYALFVQSLSLC